MKKWKIVRDTLGFFGISKEEAKNAGVKAVSMDDDITVNYITSGGTEFSGNILTGGINDDVLVPGVPGEIIINGDNPLYMSTGDTSTLVLIDEEGNTILIGDVTITTSNSNVNISGLVITAVSDGESTVTIKLNADNDVFTKLKIYID